MSEYVARPGGTFVPAVWQARCLHCGELFPQDPAARVLCSPECARAYARRPSKVNVYQSSA